MFDGFTVHDGVEGILLVDRKLGTTAMLTTRVRLTVSVDNIFGMKIRHPVCYVKCNGEVLIISS